MDIPVKPKKFQEEYTLKAGEVKQLSVEAYAIAEAINNLADAIRRKTLK